MEDISPMSFSNAAKDNEKEGEQRAVDKMS